MKIRLVFCLLFFTFLQIQKGKTQTWIWAKSSGGVGNNPSVSIYQEGQSVCSDKLGNVFITGDFYGHDIVFDTVSLLSPKNGGIFLTKYDPNGHVLWAKVFGDSSENAIASSVCTDSKGNVFVTGIFNGTAIAFDNISLFNPSFLFYAPFILKTDPSGKVLWAKTSGTITGNISSQCIVADSAGNVFITGNFEGASLTLDNTVLSNTGHANVFLAKYLANGNLAWAKSVAGSASDLSTSITADTNGNVYIAGYYTSSSIAIGSSVLTGSGNQIIFFAKYDNSGNPVWGKNVPSSNDDAEALAICTDLNKNLYLTGFFTGPDISLGSSSLTNSGYRNLFVARLDPDGNFIWAKSALMGSFTFGMGYSLAVDSQENLIATGAFSGSDIVFDSKTLVFSPGAEYNTYLVKYDSTGTVLCASSLAGGGDDEIAICTDPFGNAYLGGDYYQTPLVVGSVTLPITTGPNGENVFLAKYVCGCSSTGNITGPKELCMGQKTNLTANGGINYIWNTGASTGTLFVDPDSTTTYSMIASYGSCSDTAFFTLRVNPLPVTSVVAEHSIDYCEGGHNGSISTHTSAGTLPYTFSWAPRGDSTESITGLSKGNYQLTVTDSKGCISQAKAVVINSPELFVPNYFSPNNDGINDKECVYGGCLTDMDFSIYDRWGEKVYETNDTNICWDGYYKGMLMDTQILVYNLIATLPGGETVTKKGTINLVR